MMRSEVSECIIREVGSVCLVCLFLPCTYDFAEEGRAPVDDGTTSSMLDTSAAYAASSARYQTETALTALYRSTVKHADNFTVLQQRKV